MPAPSNHPNPARVLVAGLIVGVHAGAIAIAMNLYSRPVVKVESKPIIVRLISQAAPRPEWTPPAVVPVVLPLTTPTPQVPVIEIPVSESNRAITVPVAVAMPTPPQSPKGDEAKLVDTVEYVREPQPRYPAQSRKLREQGLVVLRVLIDERGMACDIAIENSSGHERLDHAAREAVARAEFRPYVEGRVARRAVVLIPIEFSLNRAAARIAANGA